MGSEMCIRDRCNDILAENRIPDDWKYSTLVPIFKGRGDSLDCGNYRGLKLTDHALKVYERVLERRIREQVHINEMQFGFMPGKGTTDAIFIVRQLQEKYLAKKKDLYFAFVDLEKAFDRVPREVVKWALRKLYVDEWLVQAVMTLYEDAKTSVRFGGEASESFDVKVGLHQGSVLSPLLFVIVMNATSSGVASGLPYEILYADDLALIAESEAELQEKLKSWDEGLTSKGLRVNVNKTKVMRSEKCEGVAPVKCKYPCSVCSRNVGQSSIQCTDCRLWTHRKCSEVKGSLIAASGSFKCKRCSGAMPAVSRSLMKDMTLERGNCESVSRFCYLGDMLERGGGSQAAVTARIQSGWKKFHDLSAFLTSRATPYWMKGKIYSSCVRPCMMYGSETWGLTAIDKKRLETSERRMVRWMCGVSLKDGIASKDLLHRLKIRSVEEEMKTGRLRWYGHVVRRDGDNWLKRTWKMKVEGPTPRGRPKKTWEETISADCRSLGLNVGDALNRDSWRAAIKNNRPTQRSWRNGR